MQDLEHLQKYYWEKIKPIAFSELLERIKNFHWLDLFDELLKNNKDKMEEEDNDLQQINDSHWYPLYE